MAKIIECVPNVSEGRDKKIIQQLINVVKQSPGVNLADYSSDPDHNRTVLTMFGAPDDIVNMIVDLAVKAVKIIDLTKQSGEHPRMGAIDVIPFIPVREMTMDEVVIISKKAAERIWIEAGLPIFLYEYSATSPHRRNLADIRRGQFEKMAEKVLQDGWEPDYGGCTIHPTAGVTAVGARKPLIAFNINLSTSDVTIANKIAKIIRYSNGGFEGVKAIGILLKSKNTAQVSINMTDLDKTPLYKVVEKVKEEATCYGVAIVDTEIIGLSPKQAIIDCAEYYLKLSGFDSIKQIIENHIVS